MNRTIMSIFLFFMLGFNAFTLMINDVLNSEEEVEYSGISWYWLKSIAFLDKQKIEFIDDESTDDNDVWNNTFDYE